MRELLTAIPDVEVLYAMLRDGAFYQATSPASA